MTVNAAAYERLREFVERFVEQADLDDPLRSEAQALLGATRPTRYNWDWVPKDVNFVATDCEGASFGFADSPVFTGSEWINSWSSDHDAVFLTSGDRLTREEAFESLEQRPR